MSIFFGARLEVKSHQDAFRIREVPDDLPQRLRKLSHQGRDGHYLIAFRKLRVPKEVNYFDVVLSWHVFLTDLLEICKGGDRLRRLSCHIKPQLPHPDRRFRLY